MEKHTKFGMGSGLGYIAWAAALLGVLGWLSACAPAPQKEEELRREIQGLKAEIAALKEKLSKVEGSQQTLLALLQKGGTGAEPPAPLDQPPVAEPLTVSRLLKEKDRFLGQRVTVKGPVGPVLMHHKTLFLKAPEGLVEVAFGNLPDKNLIARLTSISIEGPITVTGSVGLSPREGAQLRITAEAVDF